MYSPSKPDAIVVLAFDETKSIIPELAAPGCDMSKIYYSDGNTADYSKDFEPGTLEGAQGTIPGADPDADFKDRLAAWSEVGRGRDLKDFSYGAESYDATILAALAAVKGGANDSATVQKNFAAVSGATDGEECTTFADCVALLDGGKEIRYTGPRASVRSTTRTTRPRRSSASTSTTPTTRTISRPRSRVRAE